MNPDGHTQRRKGAKEKNLDRIAASQHHQRPSATVSSALEQNRDPGG
jgi:hypothetical protein